MMKIRNAIGSALAGLLLAVTGASAHAQNIPLCEDQEVFTVASEAVTDAHGKSNFAGLGTGNKVVEAMRFMVEYEPRIEVQPTIELLAGKAEYGPENIRACVTSEWIFNERALVYIMLSPEDPEKWGLFMFNVALDLPVATGWLLEVPPQ